MIGEDGLSLSRRSQSNGIDDRTNRTQSNAIDRLKFDCRTQSNLNRISKSWVIFNWFDRHSTAFDSRSTAFEPLLTVWLGSTTLAIVRYCNLLALTLTADGDLLLEFEKRTLSSYESQSNAIESQSNAIENQSNLKIAVIFDWDSIAFDNRISIIRLRLIWFDWFDRGFCSIEIVW